MNAIDALIYVNIVIWTGFAIYAFFLARKQNVIDKRLKSLMIERPEEE